MTEVLPRVYPTKQEWKEGIAFLLLDQGDYNLFEIWEPLSFNVLKGFGVNGEDVTKYFIVDHLVGGLIWGGSKMEIAVHVTMNINDQNDNIRQIMV